MWIGIEARWGRCIDVADMGCIVVIGRYAVWIVRDVSVAESASLQMPKRWRAGKNKTATN